MHPAAVGEKEINAFGAVHRTAAAESDDQVRIDRLREDQSGLDVFGRRVLMDAFEQVRFESGLAQRRNAVLGVTRGDDPWVAHDDHAVGAKPGGQVAELIDRVRAKDDSRLRLKVEGDHVCDFPRVAERRRHVAWGFNPRAWFPSIVDESPVGA